MTGKSRGNCTVSLPEMRRGGVAVCLATLLCRALPRSLPEMDGNLGVVGERRHGEIILREDLDYAQPVDRLCGGAGPTGVLPAAGSSGPYAHDPRRRHARCALGGVGAGRWRARRADRLHPEHGGGRPDRRAETGGMVVAARAAHGLSGALWAKRLRHGDRRRWPADAAGARAAQGIRAAGDDSGSGPYGRYRAGPGAGDLLGTRVYQPRQLPRPGAA